MAFLSAGPGSLDFLCVELNRGAKNSFNLISVLLSCPMSKVRKVGIAYHV